MKELINRYGSKMPRRTEITIKDYNFVSDGESTKIKAEDNSRCYYAFKNGFLRKCKSPINDRTSKYSFEGKANDVLIAFDNRGRILRVYCSDIPLYGQSDIGLYIPRYCNIPVDDDYKITWIGKITGDELMLLYTDGNFGFVNTSEWDNNSRKVKVLERGISKVCADKLGAVFSTKPKYLFVSDINGKIGWVDVGKIKRKDRTAKTKVFNVGKNSYIDTYACYDTMPSILLNEASQYESKLKKLKDLADFRGDISDFVNII